MQSGAPEAYDRGTMTLLFDSIVLAMEASDSPHSDLGHTLSRASVLATTLFVEACANACLDTLALNRNLAADVDRLGIVAKYDLVARTAFPKRPFDRSRHEVQCLAELKQVRDCFVHPKGQKIIWDYWSEDSSASRSPRTKKLDLPKIAHYCYFDDSTTALRAAHEFLRYFFRSICRYGPVRVTALLMSEDSRPNLKDKTTPYWTRDIHKWLRNHKIDISYIRIGST
jgi:hypothetical protein